MIIRVVKTQLLTKFIVTQCIIKSLIREYVYTTVD